MLMKKGIMDQQVILHHHVGFFSPSSDAGKKEG